MDFLKNAEHEFENYLVLLTKKLYRGIEETLRQMNGLRTSYISSGGNIEEVIAKYYHLKEELIISGIAVIIIPVRKSTNCRLCLRIMILYRKRECFYTVMVEALISVLYRR